MTRRTLARGSSAGAVLLGSVVLAGCGGSDKALIPSANAGVLQADFDNVSTFASAGNCKKATGWVDEAQRDLAKLPATVDRGLVAQLRAGLADLGTQAQDECAQSAATATTTTTSTSTTRSSSVTSSALATTTATTTLSAPVTTTTASALASTTAPAAGGTPAGTATTTVTLAGGGQGAGGQPAGGNGAGGVGAP